MPPKPSPSKDQIKKVVKNQKAQLKFVLAGFFNAYIPGTTLKTTKIHIGGTTEPNAKLICFEMCVDI